VGFATPDRCSLPRVSAEGRGFSFRNYSRKNVDLIVFVPVIQFLLTSSKTPSRGEGIEQP
jgi:hypothetical protein